MTRVQESPLALKAAEHIEAAYSSVDVDEVVQTIERLGFRCTVGGALIGISGASHKFDIVCKGVTTRVTIEFLQNRDEQASEIALVSSRAKFYDCAPDLGVVICLNEMNQALKGLSTFYRLSMLEAHNTREVCEKLTKLLEENSLGINCPALESTTSSDAI